MTNATTTDSITRSDALQMVMAAGFSEVRDASRPLSADDANRRVDEMFNPTTGQIATVTFELVNGWNIATAIEFGR